MHQPVIVSATILAFRGEVRRPDFEQRFPKRRGPRPAKFARATFVREYDERVANNPVRPSTPVPPQQPVIQQECVTQTSPPSPQDPREPVLQPVTESTPSRWEECVVDIIALLHSVDVYIDNSNVKDDKRMTEHKMVARLGELLGQAESSAVAVTNMSGFLREAQQGQWYCLEDAIVRGQWTPLEHPTPGECVKHSKCLQGFVEANASNATKGKLRVRVFKGSRKAGV
ncbi:hypothetical protein Hte_009635 [Hypoxylon texense]